MMITAEMVKNLRESTGAGMMDCKKALTQADGNIAEAEKILKKMGLAAVAKRSDRATENGTIGLFANGKCAVATDLACETDFVARNEKFIALAKELAQIAAEKGYTEVNDELKEKVQALISTIKENMSLKKIAVVKIGENETVATYVHGGGSMGIIVKFKASSPDVLKNEEVKAFMHDIALHVAAFTPMFLSEKTVDPAYAAEQKEIFQAQVASLDKPEKVKEGIVQGKLNKLYSEICLLEHPFVKDDTVSVAKKMAEVAKAAGGNLEVVSFTCLKAGV